MQKNMSFSKEEKPLEGKRITIDPSRPPVENITSEQLEKSRKKGFPNFRIEDRLPRKDGNDYEPPGNLRVKPPKSLQASRDKV